MDVLDVIMGQRAARQHHVDIYVRACMYNCLYIRIYVYVIINEINVLLNRDPFDLDVIYICIRSA